MIRGVTFDKQLLKSEDLAHQINYFYRGKMGISKGCTISTDVSGNLVIADGYFSVYGRLIANIGNATIAVPAVASGVLYSILVFEVDLSKENTIDTFNQGAFKILSSASAYPTLTQGNLDTGDLLYQMEFCRFQNTVSGITGLTDTRTILDMTQYASSEDIDLLNSQLGDKANTTDVNTALGLKAGKSTSYTKTLAYGTWTGTTAPYSYTLSVTGATTSNNIEVLPSPSITAAQVTAMQAANIISGTQAAGSITLNAFGTKPTIDLPIVVIVRGDV